MANDMSAIVPLQRVFDGHIRNLCKTTDYWGWVEGMYLAKNDDGVALRLYHGYAYEPQSRKLWKKLCADAGLVIDVGAHTGIYSLDAWAAGAKRVLSVEPYHLNYARLLMNLRHAGFPSSTTSLCAASDLNGYGMLTVRGPNYYCSSGCTIDGSKTDSRIGQFPVHIRRLDTLLNDDMHSLVAAIKIDTERHGAAVLRGATQILQYRPDLILECIEEGLGDLLRPLGYRFWGINEQVEDNFGLEPVDDLLPDPEFSFHSPNRFASVNGLP